MRLAVGRAGAARDELACIGCEPTTRRNVQERTLEPSQRQHEKRAVRSLQAVGRRAARHALQLAVRKIRRARIPGSSQPSIGQGSPQVSESRRAPADVRSSAAPTAPRHHDSRGTRSPGVLLDGATHWAFADVPHPRALRRSGSIPSCAYNEPQAPIARGAV